MILETDKEPICINQLVAQKTNKILITDDIIVNDIKPDVLNIIDVSGIPYIYKKEVMDGKIKIDGNINIYIMYLADDETNAVRSLNTVLDFSQVINIDSCKEGMRADENINIQEVQCQILNSRKISVNANLEINIKIYEEDNVQIITDINDNQDIQVLNINKEINCLLGYGTTKVPAKDNISVDNADELAEIMKANVKIINKENKISYNKILAKAEVEIRIMYSTEDNRVNTVNTQIPIMGFIDMENVEENDICDTKYKIKNLIIKPNNTEVHSIYIEMDIEMSSFVYKRKHINLIKDLYSTSAELDCKQKQVSTQTTRDNTKEIYKIEENINISEMNNNKLYNVEVIPVINETKIQNDKIIYDGNTKLKFLFELNNSIGVKNIEIPFQFETNANEIELANIQTSVVVKGESFVVTSSGNIETSIELEFNIEILQSDIINVIDEIECKEEIEENVYSMVVYFVKPGDTIWDIAKKFKTTMEEIIQLNDIENADEIMPNTQIYIPKHVNRV